MASHPLHLTIASVGEQLFVGDVVSVTIPGADGLMTALGNHEALVTTLKPGTITVRPTEGEAQDFEVESGVLEIANGHATVLL